MFQRGKITEMLGVDVGQAYEKINNKPIPKHNKYICLKLDGETPEGVDCRFPKLKY